MEAALKELIQNLQKQVGLHRELLDALRKEHEVLISAQLRDIQEITYTKEIVLATIGQLEQERLAILPKLVGHKWIPTLPESITAIILAIQGDFPAMADTLRSSSQALRILLERIAKHNSENATLVQSSLKHIEQMKANALGEAHRKGETYTDRGNKQAGTTRESRLLSAEV